MTIKEKALLLKKLHYVKTEIANYEEAVKKGNTESFDTYNKMRIVLLNQELESISA